MEFRILGPLEAVVDGRAVAPDASKPRALRALLLLRANEVVPTDRLIEELWSGRPPATAGKVLQTYVSHLRKALGGDVLVTRPTGYELRVEPGALDLPFVLQGFSRSTDSPPVVRGRAKRSVYASALSGRTSSRSASRGSCSSA